MGIWKVLFQTICVFPFPPFRSCCCWSGERSCREQHWADLGVYGRWGQYDAPVDPRGVCRGAERRDVWLEQGKRWVDQVRGGVSGGRCGDTSAVNSWTCEVPDTLSAIGQVSGVQEKGLRGNVNLGMVSTWMVFKAMRWTSSPGQQTWKEREAQRPSSG